jgi:hypothetical protein
MRTIHDAYMAMGAAMAFEDAAVPSRCLASVDRS